MFVNHEQSIVRFDRPDASSTAFLGDFYRLYGVLAPEFEALLSVLLPEYVPLLYGYDT